jgi:hypothetical protein
MLSLAQAAAPVPLTMPMLSDLRQVLWITVRQTLRQH